jgi:hypothetical protein
VPVLARRGQYVFGQNIDDVAEFVGLQGDHVPLPPHELVGKWLNVYGAVQRYVRQFPRERLEERVIDTRDRSIRIMSHHIFRIGEAFLETAVEGAEFTAAAANVPPADGTFTTGDEIAGYGASVARRIEQWWAGCSDKSCKGKVKTFFGPQPVHMLLERSTWHSAQHARQLVAVLERFDIEPKGRLTTGDLAGLPLPERLWE